MKKLIIILSILISLVAGVFIGLTINNMVKNSKSNIYTNSNVKDNIKVETEIEDIKVDTGVEDIKVDLGNTDAKTNVKVEKTYSKSDKSVIEELSNTLENIKNSEVTEKFKDGAKKTFIDIVDFLFYEGTIKGVTFKELTEAGKAKVLELANKIDNAIENKVPNYKESISDKASSAFKEISSLIKKGSGNLNDFLKEKLSEEHYNAIVKAKESIKDYSSDAISYIKENGSKLLSEAKGKLSAWYNSIKDKN